MLRSRMYIAAFLSLAVLCASSCEREVSQENEPVLDMSMLEPMEFEAGFASDAKTVLNDDRSVSWTKGDKVTVFSDNFTSGTQFQTGDDGALVNFAGSAFPAEPRYYAIYPAESGDAAAYNKSAKTLTAKLLSSQRGINQGTFPKLANLMVARSENGSLSFEQVCALFKITVPEDITDLKSIIVFPNNQDQDISGVFTVGLDADGNFVRNADGGLAVTIANGSEESKAHLKSNDASGYFLPGDYYIPVLPQNLSDGFRLKLEYGSAGEVTRAGSAASMQLKAGRVYNLGTLKRKNIFNYASFENGEIPAFFVPQSKQTISVEANPTTEGNASRRAAKVDCSAMTWETSGALEMKLDADKLKVRENFTSVRMKVYVGTNDYYPYLSISGIGKLPDTVDDVAVGANSDACNILLHRGGECWHTLEWNLGRWSALKSLADVTSSLSLRLFASSSNGSTPASFGNRVVYIDDIQFGVPDKPSGEVNVETEPYNVNYRYTDGTVSSSAEAYTVDRLPGFIRKDEPKRDEYGGWSDYVGNASGYFRTLKTDGRWWIIDPAGNKFLSQGVTTFTPGSSARQKQARDAKFGGSSASWNNWAKEESAYLRSKGFNSFGAWSEVNTIMGLPTKTPFAVIISPMGEYIKKLKSAGTESAAFAGSVSWEKYPYDFPMVFDEGFDAMIEKVISDAEKGAPKYANQKYCLGYFFDNEIPWRNTALESCFKWPASHINHVKAQQWLDKRKGHAEAKLSEATDDDKKAFIAYCFEEYIRKVTTCLRKYDKNHMVLGCRFNQWKQELSNEYIMEVAGRYMDVISFNCYGKWAPDPLVLRQWEEWSGKPCLISEFYTKGDDASSLFNNSAYPLTNSSGAGWIVETQNDRGLFYENFVIEALKSKVCVGWHWFRYQDNDPTSTSSDSSNTDANKGIVTWDYYKYEDLVSHMAAANAQTYNLAAFL